MSKGGNDGGSLTEPHKHDVKIGHREHYTFQVHYGDESAYLMNPYNGFMLDYRLNRLVRKLIRKHDRRVATHAAALAYAARNSKEIKP